MSGGEWNMTLKVLYKNGSYAYISNVSRTEVKENLSNIMIISYSNSQYNTFLVLSDVIYIGEEESITDNIEFHYT